MRAGVGLTSMRERTAELGGTCVIEPVPTGGTRIAVRLPLSVS
jgi:two-component system NarL family sensor kinase